MTPGSRTHPDDVAAQPDDQPESAAAGRVLARVESADGGEECTLFPADADPEDLVTTWVTAAEDSFVDLADWR